MKDFITALIVPSRMRKFRYMSILIAMLIFVVSIYLISIPHNVFLNQNKEKFIKENSYVSVYEDLENTALSDDFKNQGYKVVKNAMTSKTNEGLVKIFQFNTDATIKGEQKNINLYVVFDPKSTLLDNTEKIKKGYLAKFENAKYAQSIAYLIYIDSLSTTDEVNDAWYEGRYTYYNSLSKEEIQKIYQSKNNFDLYGIKITGENNYLTIFLKDQLITQIAYKAKEGADVTYPALTSYYSNCDDIDFTSVTTLKEFGTVVANGLFKALKETEKTRYLFNVIIYAIIYPAIYCLLLFWCMRKRGTMKTYKEYYNVASIASIIPVLATFIIGWFVPNAVLIYGIGFSVMTLIAFYKINLTPEQGV